MILHATILFLAWRLLSRDVCDGEVTTREVTTHLLTPDLELDRVQGRYRAV